MTFLSFAQNISEVPQDLARRYQGALGTDQQPPWSLLEAGWPSTASSRAFGLPCNQAVQTLLPFTQINSENTASRITRRDAWVERELSWHLIQIAASCKELFLSFVSICLRKVPSAAYKCANSPFKEIQLRTARSALHSQSNQDQIFHNQSIAQHTAFLQSTFWWPPPEHQSRPPLIQWVLCVLHKITGSTQLVTRETTHTEAAWLLLEASPLFPLQQAWNYCRRLRKKGKKGNSVSSGCCTWPDQWGETIVCWVIRSSCMKALFKLKRSVREKKQATAAHNGCR